MFIPDYFKNTDFQANLRLMRENPFAYFITSARGRVMFTPLPAIIEQTSEKVIIYAHMAAMNDHSRYIEGAQMTVVFMGPHHYISPRWYMDPRSVPTWNYALVIAKGEAELLDHEGTIKLLKDLSNTFDPEWSSLEKEKEEYYQKMIPQIVAFRLICDTVDGKFKLSQNHPIEDRKRVVAELETSDHEGKLLADLMYHTVL
jgi:transcriptional regulator